VPKNVYLKLRLLSEEGKHPYARFSDSVCEPEAGKIFLVFLSHKEERWLIHHRNTYVNCLRTRCWHAAIWRPLNEIKRRLWNADVACWQTSAYQEQEDILTLAQRSSLYFSLSTWRSTMYWWALQPRLLGLPSSYPGL